MGFSKTCNHHSKTTVTSGPIVRSGFEKKKFFCIDYGNCFDRKSSLDKKKEKTLQKQDVVII